MIDRARTASNLCRLALSVLILVAFSYVPASAQEGSSQRGSIELVDQSDWVSGGSPFQLAVKVDTNIDLEQAELAITVYAPTPNRSQFQQTLDGDGLGQVVILERQSLEGSIGPDGIVRVSIPVQDPQQKRFFLRSTGVFPVKVELRNQGTTQPIDSFTTHLANLAPNANVSSKLGVVPILNAASPADRNDVLALPDKGESLTSLSGTLAANPQLPISTLPSPESVERVGTDENSEAIFSELRTAIGPRQILSTTWVPADAALFDKSLRVEGRLQVNRGRDVTQRLLGRSDNRVFVSRARTDVNAIREMRQAGAERLLLMDDSLQNRPALTTLRPFELSDGQDSTVDAMQIDTGLFRHYIDSDGPVLGAHRLLAELAVLWNDTPGQSRAVLMTGPPDVPLNPTFANIVLRGISDSPFVQPMSLDAAFELPKASPTLRRTLPTDNDDRFNEGDLRKARERTNSVGSVFGPNSPTRDQIQRRLLYSESAILDQRRQSDLLDKASDATDEVISHIRLPGERSIRLTASEGELPVSVQNDTGEPIRVVVRLSSDRASFPDGVTRTLDLQRSQLTNRFPIEAKTSGVFPVQMRLETPDGSMILARSQTLVSSTATTGVGLALSIGAGAFLVLWWIRSALKSRRKES